ncbi:hypothetical protein BD779DRAFT_213611 [Infundibulicybe gibba]|nr:hypothetical protein BD779DRAFT_213611 [Infundibulicybe gibba]
MGCTRLVFMANLRLRARSPATDQIYIFVAHSLLVSLCTRRLAWAITRAAAPATQEAPPMYSSRKHPPPIPIASSLTASSLPDRPSPATLASPREHRAAPKPKLCPSRLRPTATTPLKSFSPRPCPHSLHEPSGYTSPPYAVKRRPARHCRAPKRRLLHCRRACRCASSRWASCGADASEGTGTKTGGGTSVWE